MQQPQPPSEGAQDAEGSRLQEVLGGLSLEWAWEEGGAKCKPSKLRSSSSSGCFFFTREVSQVSWCF